MAHLYEREQLGGGREIALELAAPKDNELYGFSKNITS